MTNIVLYFVEGNNAVKGQNTLEYENYQSEIVIDKVGSLFSVFNLKHEEPFLDIDIYSNDHIEICFFKNPEENFYVELNSNKQSLKEYLQIINLIALEVFEAANSQDLDIIEALMETFNLNLYSKDHKKHFENIDELRKFLREQNLLDK